MLGRCTLMVQMGLLFHRLPSLSPESSSMWKAEITGSHCRQTFRPFLARIPSIVYTTNIRVGCSFRLFFFPLFLFLSLSSADSVICRAFHSGDIETIPHFHLKSTVEGRRFDFGSFDRFLLCYFWETDSTDVICSVVSSVLAILLFDQVCALEKGRRSVGLLVVASFIPFKSLRLSVVLSYLLIT